LPDLLFLPMTDWHTRIQRTQHLVSSFAELGFRCIYVNPHLGREFESTPLFDRSHRLSRLAPNIFELHIRLPREPVFHHRLLSGKEEKIVAEAIAQVLPVGGRAAGHGVIQIVSFPLWLGVAQEFRKERAAPIVYDCHDLLEGFQNVSKDLVRAEEDLLRAADLVLFSSEGLRKQNGGVKRAKLVRNAVNAAQFQPGSPAERLVAGYVGALDSWFDVEAVEQAALQHPRCRFVLAGRIEFLPIERLGRLPNVELAGEIAYSEVPELMARFRIALIPFRINPLTLATNPIKLYEYFSCGLPVVTTPLPEAQAMGGLVYVAEGPTEFARQVGLALQEDDAARRTRRREIALRESWAARAQDISSEFGSL
jgi:glycosyltransferase involved in cell wall biosynthesis